MIMITLNKIISKRPCRDGLKRLLKAQGKPEDYKGDDIEFPMYEILNSNILDDAIWAMRCLPEHALLWRKFAVWCGNDALQVKFEEKTAAYVAFWCAKYACSKLSNTHQVLTEKDRHKSKLFEILKAGEWVE